MKSILSTRKIFSFALVAVLFLSFFFFPFLRPSPALACEVGWWNQPVIVGEQIFVQVDSDITVDFAKYPYRLKFFGPGGIKGTAQGPIDTHVTTIPDKFKFNPTSKSLWFAFSPNAPGNYSYQFEREAISAGNVVESCTRDNALNVYQRCCDDGYAYYSCVVGGSGCYKLVAGVPWCIGAFVDKKPVQCQNSQTCINFGTTERKFAACSLTQTWRLDKSCGGSLEGISTAIGCIPTNDLKGFLEFVLKWAFFASGGIIVLMVIATGYTLLTSQGNPEKLQAAKENIVALFSGLILIAFSLVLLQTIGADILKLPTF